MIASSVVDVSMIVGVSREVEGRVVAAVEGRDGIEDLTAVW